MPYNCIEALIALKSGDPRFTENSILAHFESCRACRNAFELPSEISDQITNINLLPAPGEMYDNIMGRLSSGKSVMTKLTVIKRARLCAVLAAYLGFVFILAVFWDKISLYPGEILNSITPSFGIVISHLSSRADGMAKMVDGLAQSPHLIAAMLMSATLAWAIVLVRIRDILRY